MKSEQIMCREAVLGTCLWIGIAASVMVAGCATQEGASGLQPAAPAKVQAGAMTDATSGAADSIRAERAMELTRPEIVLDNQSDRMVTVSLLGPETHSVQVAPKTRRTLALAPGHYQYVGKAEGAEPESGGRDFESQWRYTWEFRVSAVPR